MGDHFHAPKNILIQPLSKYVQFSIHCFLMTHQWHEISLVKIYILIHLLFLLLYMSYCYVYHVVRLRAYVRCFGMRIDLHESKGSPKSSITRGWFHQEEGRWVPFHGLCVISYNLTLFFIFIRCFSRKRAQTIKNFERVERLFSEEGAYLGIGNE